MELLGATLEAEGVTGPAQVGLTLIDPAEIAQLNVEHLDGEARPACSAPRAVCRPRLAAGPGRPARLIGDVVVCPAVAEAQAAGHADGPADELALLVVHAGLHLTGHDHAEYRSGGDGDP
jgi:probable rRNA maturation factor